MKSWIKLKLSLKTLHDSSLWYYPPPQSGFCDVLLNPSLNISLVPLWGLIYSSHRSKALIFSRFLMGSQVVWVYFFHFILYSFFDFFPTFLFFSAIISSTTYSSTPFFWIGEGYVLSMGWFGRGLLFIKCNLSTWKALLRPKDISSFTKYKLIIFFTVYLTFF